MDINEYQKFRIYRSDYLLPLTSFIIVVIVWMFLLYGIVKSVASFRNLGNRTINLCAVGECVTDFITGEKKCPPLGSKDQYARDPTIQSCQPRYFCTSPQIYAVQNDSSTNSQGICPDNTECRCLKNPYCAEYVIGYFNTSTGNPYSSILQDITTFIQNIDPNYTTGNRPPDNQTLGLKVSNNSFCTIPVNWIYKSIPGCSYIDYTDSIKGITSLDSDVMNISNCMLSNPCNAGTLAFIPNVQNASSFRETDISKTPVACVRGQTCKNAGQVSIYDQMYGNVICRVPLSDKEC